MHVNTHELSWVANITGIASELTGHEHGDTVTVGSIPIELLHTPGHTPGSQCFLLDGRLIAGDTLFLEGCGRTDFPGGDSDEMFRSLQKLAALTGDPTVYPGTGIPPSRARPCPPCARATTSYAPTPSTNGKP